MADTILSSGKASDLSIGYFLLTLLLEVLLYKLSLASIKKWTTKSFHDSPYSEPLLRSKESESLLSDEDIDVITERNRVLSGSIDNAIIYLRNLRKVYPGRDYRGRKVAVDSLTFSVQEGECFGFLGTNGAGKCKNVEIV